MARRSSVAALVAGAGADLVWHHGVGTIAGALVGAALPALLALAARVRRRASLVCLVAATSFAPWLAVRDSHWVLPLDIAAAVLLVLAAAADAAVAPGFVALVDRLARGAAAATVGPLQLFALWLGAVLVVAGVACVRSGRRPWLVPVVAGSALVGVFAMNVVNPEAVVVRHDVALAARGGRFDPVYLAMLSDDATPALVRAARTAPPAVASALRRQLCAPGFRHHDARPGLAANLADHRSQRLNDELCNGA